MKQRNNLSYVKLYDELDWLLDITRFNLNLIRWFMIHNSSFKYDDSETIMLIFS